MRITLFHPIVLSLALSLSAAGANGEPMTTRHLEGLFNETEYDVILAGDYSKESTAVMAEAEDSVTSTASTSAPAPAPRPILADIAGVSANAFILLKQVVDIPMLIRRCQSGKVNPQLGFWFFTFISFFQMQRVVYYFLWWIFRGFHYLAVVSVFSFVVSAVRVGSQLKFQEGRTFSEACAVAVVLLVQVFGFVASILFGYQSDSSTLSILFTANGLIMTVFGSCIILASAGDARTMWKRKSLQVISLRYNSLTFFEKVSSAIYASLIQDHFTFGFMVAATLTIATQLTEYFIIWRGMKRNKGSSNDSSKNPIGDMLVKMSKCEAEGVMFANFAIGSPSFKPPASFLKALSSSVDVACNQGSENECTKNSFMYTHPAGAMRLRDLIASEVVSPRQGGVQVSANNVVITPGAQSALVCTLHTILSPKDAVVLTRPIYPYFKTNVEMWGGVCHFADCDAHTLDIDMDSLQKAMKRGGKRLKALMLCSPGNPSGKVIEKSQLQGITRLANAHCKKYKTKVWIVMDHTYWNITWNAEVPPIFEYYDDAIVISSFSKDLGIAGERLGFAAINPKSKEAKPMAELLTTNNGLLGNICPPSTIQHAMTEFLSGPGKYDAAIYEYKQNYRECLDELYSVLREAGFSQAVMPDGGFYLFPKLPPGVKEEAFLTGLMDKNVFALPGSDFMMPGHVRFCALLPPGSDAIKIARNAIQDTLNEQLGRGVHSAVTIENENTHASSLDGLKVKLCESDRTSTQKFSDDSCV